MNIGFDAKRAFLNGSGLGNYSRSTIDLLAKYASLHNYFLYTPKSEGGPNYTPPKNTNITTPQGLINKSFKSYWRSFKLAKDIQKDNLDIFHGLSNELPHNIKKANVKSIVTIHDLIFFRYPKLYKAADRKIYHQKFKYACAEADTIIAISEQTKTDIVNFLEVPDKKIEVVYQGCNPVFYEKEADTKLIEVSQKYDLPEKYLLFLGTVEKRKNAKFIIETIKQHNITTPLVIVGKKTDYQLEVQNYIKSNNLEEQVFIHNNVPFEDLPALYQQASIFVYPSIFEGFGIPILEALNSGVPVITTKGGCFSEAGGMSTLYVSPENHDELAQAIQQIMQDKSQQKKMTSDGLKYALKFREDKVSENLLAVYSS